MSKKQDEVYLSISDVDKQSDRKTDSPEALNEKAASSSRKANATNKKKNHKFSKVVKLAMALQQQRCRTDNNLSFLEEGAKNSLTPINKEGPSNVNSSSRSIHSEADVDEDCMAQAEQMVSSHNKRNLMQRRTTLAVLFTADRERKPPAADGAFTLSEIDKFLGVHKPPAIEYLVVEVIVTKNPCNPSQLGRWAHSSIRYTLPDGQQKLVNICRPENGHELIEFYDDPADYILGIEGKGGIFSRAIGSVRIEELNDDSIYALDYYFRSTVHRFKANGDGVKFKLTGGFWHNVVRFIFRMKNVPSGNCARWVSKGLVYANVLNRQSMFPKAIWVEMLETQSALNPDNVNIVYYNRIKAKIKQKPFLKTGFSFTNAKAFFLFPMNLLQTFLYWDMSSYANVIVDNEDGISIEDQCERLQCVLKEGKKRRLGQWFIFFLRVFQFCVVLALCLFFILYCDGSVNSIDNEFFFDTCEDRLIKTLGYRIGIVIVFLSIFEFWLY